MLAAVLDTNVYDKFEADPWATELLLECIGQQRIEIVMPDMVRRELAARPAGEPRWLHPKNTPDRVVVPGLSIVGNCCPSSGEMLKAHLGASLVRGKDAIIVESAHRDADIFVTDDPKCRKRAAAQIRSECLSFDEFVRRLKTLKP